MARIPRRSGGCACCVCQQRADFCRFCSAGAPAARRGPAHPCRADYCSGAGRGQALWGLTARGRAGQPLQGSLLGLGWYPPEPGAGKSRPRRLLEVPAWKLPLVWPG